MESIKYKEYNENKPNDIFEQENENYKIKLGNNEYSFEFSNPEEFFYFLSITRKIIEIYNSNEENGKFYLDKISYGNEIWGKDLVLDNSWINDTTYLSYKALLKTIDNNLPEDYVKFLNTIIEKKIGGNYFEMIKEVLLDNYSQRVKNLYTKNKIIFKEIFDKYSFVDFYNDYKYYSLWKEKKKPEILLAKKFYDAISVEKLSKPDIFSLVLLNYLLDYGYKIKYTYDLKVSAKTYSEHIEFSHLKNLFPKNVKVNYFNEKYSGNIAYLKFVLAGDNVRIIGVSKNKEKIDVGIINLPKYYKVILEKSRN